MGRELLRRRAVHADELDPEDVKMLGRLFVKAIKGVEKEIAGEVEEFVMELVLGGPHQKLLWQIVIDEGFAGDTDEASDLVIDLTHLWEPEITRIVHEAIP
jgi:hypothetical protein